MAIAEDFSEAFDSSLGNYNNTFGSVVWNSSEGNVSPGCADIEGGQMFAEPGTNFDASYASLNTLKFSYRVVGADTYSGDDALVITVSCPSGANRGQITWVFPESDIIVSDTGWISLVWDLWLGTGDSGAWGITDPASTLIDLIRFQGGVDGGYTVYIDDIELTPSTGDFRFINLAEGGGNLYATAYDVGTLKLFNWTTSYPIGVEYNSFGSATLTELDSKTKACDVAAVPGSQADIIIYGLDGNGVIIQRSTDKGINFTSIGDISWVSKVALGLHIDPIDLNDFVIVFNDDDIYQTLNAGELWQKTGDVPAGSVNASARHQINNTQMLLGAATQHYTNNLGATFTNVDNVDIGIVNQIIGIPTNG